MQILQALEAAGRPIQATGFTGRFSLYLGGSADFSLGSDDRLPGQTCQQEPQRNRNARVLDLITYSVMI